MIFFCSLLTRWCPYIFTWIMGSSRMFLQKNLPKLVQTKLFDSFINQRERPVGAKHVCQHGEQGEELVMKQTLSSTLHSEITKTTRLDYDYWTYARCKHTHNLVITCLTYVELLFHKTTEWSATHMIPTLAAVRYIPFRIRRFHSIWRYLRSRLGSV